MHSFFTKDLWGHNMLTLVLLRHTVLPMIPIQRAVFAASTPQLFYFTSILIALILDPNKKIKVWPVPQIKSVSHI